MNETTQQPQPLQLKQVYALIGCGKFGKIHLSELLAAKAKVKYICNKSGDKFSSLLKEFNILSTTLLTTDYMEVLQDKEVTVVVIASGPHEHYLLTKLALNYGKHVICEKPFVFEFEQCKELFELAREKNLTLTINYPDLFSEWLRAYFYPRVTNKIEQPTTIFYQNGGWGPFREDYSVAWDYGSHVAAFAIASGFYDLYKSSNILTFGNGRSSFTSHFSSESRILVCEFGNIFPNRQKGVTVQLPDLENPTGGGHFLIGKDLKEERTLPLLYRTVEFDIDNLQEFFNKVHNFYYLVNAYVIKFCSDLESSLKPKS
jgi:hypothetical protein